MPPGELCGAVGFTDQPKPSGKGNIMAVPRQKKSRSRRQNQRAHDSLTKPNSSKCSNCGAARMPHRVCGACGWYNGKTVIEVDAD